MARILCLDDDRDCLVILHNFLKLGGHEGLPLMRGDRVIQEIRDNNPELVITDIMMPGVTGGIVYNAIRKEVGPNMPIIVSSGSNLKLKFPPDPLLDYCPKPVDMDLLLKTVDRLIAEAAKQG